MFYGDGAIHVKGVGLFRSGGGKRGEIKGFSRASRLRLWSLLASLDYEAIRRDYYVYFVTLTIQADAWKERPNMRALKRALNAFWVSMKEKWGEEIGVIWKLEYTKQDVAHIHFLLITKERFKKLKPWITKAWPRVFMRALGFKSEDERIKRMLKASTNIEPVPTVENLLQYLGKYTAKTVENVQNWTGRMWGVVNKKFINRFKRVEVVAHRNPEVFWKVRRAVVRWIKKNRKKPYKLQGAFDGVWVFFTTKAFKRDLERFLKTEIEKQGVEYGSKD